MGVVQGSFNGDISNWDVGNATSMSHMFFNNKSFNQDLTGWCVENVSNYVNFDGESSILSAINLPPFGTSNNCP